MPPDLVSYGSVNEYHEHYKRTYCRQKIFTTDGIRVYFDPDTFFHAFFKTCPKTKRKAGLCPKRSERIDWVKATLENGKAEHYKGWYKHSGTVDDRRVSVVYEDFIVVLKLSMTKKSELKAKFVTAFCADNSLRKIKAAPKWSFHDCVEELKKSKKSGR